MAAGFVAEVILTMFLVLTVLGATDITAPVGFAGLAIGLVLTLIHLVGIPITNTSVNPARSIGPAIFVGGWALQQLWLFIVAPFVGAIIAALVYAGLRHSAVLITTKKAEQALPGEQIDRIA
jgi:aquaporin Z